MLCFQLRRSAGQGEPHSLLASNINQGEGSVAQVLASLSLDTRIHTQNPVLGEHACNSNTMEAEKTDLWALLHRQAADLVSCGCGVSSCLREIR